MINVKVSKIEKYWGKISKFDFEIICNVNIDDPVYNSKSV